MKMVDPTLEPPTLVVDPTLVHSETPRATHTHTQLCEFSVELFAIATIAGIVSLQPLYHSDSHYSP